MRDFNWFSMNVKREIIAEWGELVSLSAENYKKDFDLSDSFGSSAMLSKAVHVVILNRTTSTHRENRVSIVNMRSVYY